MARAAAWDCIHSAASAMRGRGTRSTRSKSDCALRAVAAWRWSEARRRQVAASASTQTFMPSHGHLVCRCAKGYGHSSKNVGQHADVAARKAGLLGEDGGIHVQIGAQDQAVGLVDQDLHRNALHYLYEVA